MTAGTSQQRSTGQARYTRCAGVAKSCQHWGVGVHSLVAGKAPFAVGKQATPQPQQQNQYSSGLGGADAELLYMSTTASQHNTYAGFSQNAGLLADLACSVQHLVHLAWIIEQAALSSVVLLLLEKHSRRSIHTTFNRTLEQRQRTAG